MTTTMNTSERSISLTISLNSNPAVEGRYFLDVRDTTPGCKNRQITTRIRDHADMMSFVNSMITMAARMDIAVTLTDDTNELGL